MVVPYLRAGPELQARANEAHAAVRVKSEVLRRTTRVAKVKQSRLEENAILTLKQKIKADNRFILTTNEQLNGFEADIMFRIPDLLSRKRNKFGARGEVQSILINILHYFTLLISNIKFTISYNI